MINIFPICAILAMLAMLGRGHCGPGIKVIYSHQEKPQPDGFAEILNSSLTKYPEFSLCGRFLSHDFSTEQTTWQTVISVGKRAIVASHAVLPCDHNFKVEWSTRGTRFSAALLCQKYKWVHKDTAIGASIVRLSRPMRVHHFATRAVRPPPSQCSELIINIRKCLVTRISEEMTSTVSSLPG